MKKFKIIIISDATGDLGERFVRSIITQLPKDSFDISVKNFINTAEKLKKTLSEIKGKPLIFYLTIFSKLKKELVNFCSGKKIPCFDLTTSPMNFIVKSTGLKPQWALKKIHELNEEYLSKQKSLDFTIKHDDGQRPKGLKEADIIIVGVSRTSKTPTSIYLATKGYKVANVPFVFPSILPEEVKKIKSRKVIGFTITPDILEKIRKERSKSYKSREGNYTSANNILNEIHTAERFYRRKGWPILDVTDRAIEENAALVLKLLKKK